MILFRWLFLMLLLGMALCLAAYTITGHPAWRQRAVQLLRWSVVLGLGFFGLLILRRAAVFI
ncbi:MAG: hypothetical protein KGL90_09850 [Burkholderiales bacterium]|nr:hypothetical protein [Burkholderiales bacterium]